MKINSKLLIGLSVVVLLTIAFCLAVAGEYKKTGIVPSTGPVVSQSGRVPAFSIIIIKGRAFSAQKTEATIAEEETAYTAVQPKNQQVDILPMAYKLISRSLVSGK